MNLFVELVARLLGVTPAMASDNALRGLYLPPEASTSAGHIDWMFDVILWICIFFFVLIVVLMGLFIMRYRVKDPNAEGPRIYHNTALEVTWTAIPLGIVVVIFWLGFKGYMDLAVPPANAYEIQVTGQKWSWSFTYPTGHVDNVLHVPTDRPVTLIMTSTDVIHSMYLPAFRAKMDVFPGRYSKLWFDADEPGTYPLFCAEYCGTEHSSMISEVVVQEGPEFDEWLTVASNILATMTPEEGGKYLWEKRGCNQCHSVDGSAGIGPTFVNLFGAQRAFGDGTTTVADENYIRKSILEPQSQIVAGFDGVMPTFQGRFNDEELGAMIAYIKSLTSS